MKKLGPFELNRVHCGHILDILPRMPAGCIHTICTSPPYWGLRDYGIEPVVWGGENGCVHVWGEVGAAHHPGQVADNKAVHAENAVGQNKGSGQFCRHCNAWRGSLGLEPTPELFIIHLVQVFRELWRVLRDDGTCWLNLADSYNSGGGTTCAVGGGLRDNRRREPNYRQTFSGLKPKDLCGIPWRVALALQADGWWLRSDPVWFKPNPMPESVHGWDYQLYPPNSHLPCKGKGCDDCFEGRWGKDRRGAWRPTKAHEYIFLLAKSERYFGDADAVREDFNYPDRKYNTVPDNHKTYALKEQGNRCTSGLHDGREQYGDPMKGRNLRTVWEIPTQPYSGAHFATFPEEIPRRCIKAGTSERGCCPECGKPWVRVVERKGGTLGQSWHDHSNDLIDGNSRIDYGSLATAGKQPYKVSTIGFRPSCTCNAGEPVPCVVCDPFAGSGRTVKVAIDLGRYGIGFDINDSYVDDLAQPQLEAQAKGITVKELEQGQRTLFDE